MPPRIPARIPPGYPPGYPQGAQPGVCRRSGSRPFPGASQRPSLQQSSLASPSPQLRSERSVEATTQKLVFALSSGRWGSLASWGALGSLRGIPFGDCWGDPLRRSVGGISWGAPLRAFLGWSPLRGSLGGIPWGDTSWESLWGIPGGIFSLRDDVEAHFAESQAGTDMKRSICHKWANTCDSLCSLVG